MSRGSGAPIARSRAAFLARLDGLVVGQNPANGVFVDRRFLHPELGFVWDVPAGWRSGNTPEAALASEPDGRAVLLLQVVGEGRDPVVGARADGLPEELVRQLERLQIDGLSAARVIAKSGRARLDLTWIAHDDHVYRIAGVSREGEFERFQQAFVQSARSFRPMDDADRRRVAVVRLRSAPARGGESLTAFVRRAGGVWNAEQTAIANGIEVDSPLEPGWPVKVPVRETYGGSRS